MIRSVVTTGRKALLLVPFVSVAAEKVDSLHSLLAPARCQVRGFYSGGSELSAFASTDIAVCTFERANSLLNYCAESEPALCGAIGVIVCDEVHMISDPHRGARACLPEGCLLVLLMILLGSRAHCRACADQDEAPPALQLHPGPPLACLSIHELVVCR